MSGYYNLELKPDLRGVTTRPHQLNRKYKSAQRFVMRAPDAPGTLVVWALDEQEARDHLINALFELLFRPAPGSALTSNPPCPFCGGHAQSHGRNSSGKRNWKCMAEACGRYFVLDRVWRGGINHPAQSKKPEFVRLLLSGVSVRDAANRLNLHMNTAGNWAEKVAANNPEAMVSLSCPCGKPIRHRGSCWYRMGKSPTVRREAAHARAA